MTHDQPSLQTVYGLARLSDSRRNDATALEIRLRRDKRRNQLSTFYIPQQSYESSIPLNGTSKAGQGDLPRAVPP